MVAAGVKRAVGTSDDAVTRRGVLALPMWPFAGSTVSPEARYNIKPNISGVKGRTTVLFP